MEKLHQMGILRRRSSEFLSPIMLIKKSHSGAKLNKAPEYQLVVDFKYLNSHLPHIKFSYQEIKHVLHKIGRRSSQVYSVLNLKSAFHLINLTENSNKYTTFCASPGLPTYQYNKLSQGLNVSPAYFNSLMNDLLHELPSDIKHWLYRATSVIHANKLSVVPAPPDKLHKHMIKLLDMAKWIMQESINPKNNYPMTKTVVHTLISPIDPCLYVNTMYYNYSLNIDDCTNTFKGNLNDGIWSYYTLHLLMDVYDIHSVINCKEQYMNESVLQHLMPNTNKFLSNITIHLLIDFYNNQSLLVYNRFYMDESVL